MEVIAIGPHNRSQNPLLVDQMHRLRARVFKERMGWDVTAIDGQEFDRFDELNPTSILVVDRGVVVGHTRVLPAIGPDHAVGNLWFSGFQRRLCPALENAGNFAVLRRYLDSTLIR